MIGTIDKLADIPHFIHSVGEVFSLHQSAEFKRILHITTFFVVGAKVALLQFS